MKKFLIKILFSILGLLTISISISLILENLRYNNSFFNIKPQYSSMIIGSSRSYHNLILNSSCKDLTKPNLYLSDTYNILNRINIPKNIDTIYIELQDVNYSSNKNQQFFDGPSKLLEIASNPIKNISLLLENSIINYSYGKENIIKSFPPKEILIEKGNQQDYKALRADTNSNHIISYLKDSLNYNSRNSIYGSTNEQINNTNTVAIEISKKLRTKYPKLHVVFFISYGTYFKRLKSLDNRTVIDLRENLNLLNEDIYDYRHLTLTGAKKMTSSFLNKNKK